MKILLIVGFFVMMSITSAFAGIKDLTILHINDFHASFLPHKMYAVKDRPMGGGAPALSGYLAHYRQSEDALFFIAGDIFQGSVIDVITKGEAVVEVVNEMKPDVMCLGNHEFDFGVDRYKEMQEKMDFPAIAANGFEKGTNKLLGDSSHIIIEKNGVKILVIGVLTDLLNSSDSLSKELIVTDPYKEVARITKANPNVDLTILLTHIGFTEDKALANQLTAADGVDLIIGGHSHTVLKEPVVENGIPIFHAGANTDYLGSIKLKVDTASNKLVSYEGSLITVLDGKYEANPKVAGIVERYNAMASEKMDIVISELNQPLLHPSRTEETELGNFACDVLLDYFKVDLAFQNSGGLRKPIPLQVKLRHVLETFPFGNTFVKFKLTGKQLKLLLENNANSKNGDWYQMPKTLSYKFDSRKPDGQRVVSIKFKGKEITDDQMFTAVTNNYVWGKGAPYLGQDQASLIANGGYEAVLDLDKNIYIDYLKAHKGNMPNFGISQRIVDIGK
jgi:5'-nucleotidase / UDP-sugar diphosphatase